MSAHVKRSYDSSGRRRLATQRRTRILAAARELFADPGYSTTTVETLAAAAGVSVETVYLAFGSKANLLAQAVDSALAGDEEPVALLDRPMFQEVRQAATQEAQVELLARNARTILERSGRLQWTLLTLSGHDPDVATLVDTYQRRRLQVQTQFVGWIAERGPLAPGLTVEEGGKVLWTFASSEIHHMQRAVLGRSADDYERWLVRMLRQTLLA